MATTSILSSGAGGGALNTTGTQFLNIGAVSGSGSTETQQNFICSTSGTFSNFRMVLQLAPGAGTSRIFTVRKNTTNTSVVVTISNTDLTGQDTVNSFTVVAGDLITISSAVSGAVASTTAHWSIQFTGDTVGESMMSYNSSGGNMSTTSTMYYPPVGIANDTWATENQANIVIPETATIKNLYIVLDTAPGAGTSRVFTVRKNGATPANSLTVTISEAATTGNDTTNTVSVVAGDLICIMTEITGTPAATKWRVGVTYVSNTDGNFMVTQQDGSTSGGALNPAATEFLALQDASVIPSGTEINFQQAGQSCTVKSIHVNLTGAPGAGDSYVFTLRVNGANSSPALTTTVSESDTYATTATNVTINNDDLLCTTVAPTGTPTAVRCSVSYLISTGGGSAIIPPFIESDSTMIFFA